MLFNNNGSMAQNHEDRVSPEDHALIMEAAILESATPEELEAFLENHTEVQAAIHDEVLLEKTIVRLDKKARISQAQKVAIFTIAKEKNDPEFKKLVTVWRMERYLEDRLMKKYGNEGLRRAKKTVDKASRSKSNMVKKAATRAKKQWTGSAPTMPSVQM